MPFGAAFFMPRNFLDLIATMGKSEITAIVKFILGIIQGIIFLRISGTYCG